jgi:hypothetical protein
VLVLVVYLSTMRDNFKPAKQGLQGGKSRLRDIFQEK